jgi:RES domain
VSVRIELHSIFPPEVSAESVLAGQDAADLFHKSRLKSPAEDNLFDALTFRARYNEVSDQANMNAEKLRDYGTFGESAFYGASDSGTAHHETPIDHSRKPVLSKWVPSRTLKVVDLTRFPTAPSYWDSARTEQRHWLHFLREFAAEVSVEIGPHDKVRDYRPTQAVSYAIREWGKADGIVFASSKSGKPNCVLFVGNGRCVDAYPTAGSDLYLVLEDVIE